MSFITQSVEPLIKEYPERIFAGASTWISRCTNAFSYMSIGVLIHDALFEPWLTEDVRLGWLTVWLIACLVGGMATVVDIIHSYRWHKAYFINNFHLKLTRRSLDQAYKLCRQEDKCHDSVTSKRHYYILVADTLNRCGYPASMAAHYAHQSYLKQLRAPQ